MSADRILQRVWYERAPFVLFLLLLPLSIVFGGISLVRRFLYRSGWLRAIRVERPVLIVGNVSVGGTGKTPLVIWLAQRLEQRGRKVGIVTRGYGGRATSWPQDVTAETPAEQVGDEAALLASRTQALVVAGPDRVAAANRVIERGADVVLSDDGLQHYRLMRDAEIVVIDAQRRFGNGWLLPAGPLRELPSRALRADLIVESQRDSEPKRSGEAIVSVQGVQDAINLQTGERRSLAAFGGTAVHAVAAIGHPEAFFAMLRRHGLTLNAHPFPDHAALLASDLDFGDAAPVLMTEKDAVKCRAFASDRYWAVPLMVTFSEADENSLLALLQKLVRSPFVTHEAGGRS